MTVKHLVGLGIICVLVGGGLVLPRQAFAVTLPDCRQVVRTVGTTAIDFVTVGEFLGGDSGQAPSEIAACLIEGLSVTASADLVSPEDGDPNLIASDWLDLVGTPAVPFISPAFTTVTLTSDQGEPVELPLVRRSNLLGLFPALTEVPGGVSADIGTNDAGQTVNLTVISDAHAVPEPSAWLLLGSVLPALVAMRRFAPRHLGQ